MKSFPPTVGTGFVQEPTPLAIGDWAQNRVSIAADFDPSGAGALATNPEPITGYSWRRRIEVGR